MTECTLLSELLSALSFFYGQIEVAGDTTLDLSWCYVYNRQLSTFSSNQR